MMTPKMILISILSSNPPVVNPFQPTTRFLHRLENAFHRHLFPNSMEALDTTKFEGKPIRIPYLGERQMDNPVAPIVSFAGDRAFFL
jgi:hypothetical protein